MRWAGREHGRAARGRFLTGPALAVLPGLAAGLAAVPAAADPDLAMLPRGAVLAAICGRPADREAGTCRMRDGRTAEFWTAAMFSTETGSWFTGFVTMPAPGEDAAAPDRRSVAAATYALKDMRWRLEGVQVLSGRIGTGNRNGGAPEVDERFGAVFRPLSRGRLLMGLRLTVYGTAGSQGFSFLLLQFRDAPARWALAGEVAAGADETAGCAENPCRLGSSTGRLEILPEDPRDPAAWPPVRVTLSGTVLGADGTLRPATDRDARVHRFDPAAGAYR
ncbi:hypothetical protein ACXR8U_08145 [Methylobacterium radiotolerans]|jgi:hypothetical protein|uniref:hypothetical protein n=1 Tax=Methylobacterium TaxID=407 RepID=UPI0005E0012A|nr:MULTISPECIES: hypothetical protein [Methylobacterium]MBN6820516.1 hypothetical protein [Methylobacterium organophilum]OXE38797.1 hypothetical protein CCS92_27500 [Methylobacterium radiotolerans]GAN50788.1 hypothetical protein ME121_4843 [Methylobacterium sp. ME121]